MIDPYRAGAGPDLDDASRCRRRVGQRDAQLPRARVWVRDPRPSRSGAGHGEWADKPGMLLARSFGDYHVYRQPHKQSLIGVVKDDKSIR